jgi:hypothetical protein
MPFYPGNPSNYNWRSFILKTFSQIDYEIDALKREKEKLKKSKIEEKVQEFSKIFTDTPPKDEEDLKRLLRQFAQDIREIHEY